MRAKIVGEKGKIGQGSRGSLGVELKDVVFFRNFHCCEYGRMHATARVWRSEDNFREFNGKSSLFPECVPGVKSRSLGLQSEPAFS